jgi:GH25 family lysozyme M1 (1,4-beta-N-acetylmuramidase)
MDYHQPLGRAGDSQRYYKPQRNWNRVVNNLFGGDVKAFPPSAVIVQQKKIPDVSFYQGLIDWNLMRSKTDAIIIRAGQNTWIDSMFRVNYAAAKMRGMLRGIYWFYDDRVSPGEQLAALAEAIGADIPEMEIWVDWERFYGGQFGGLKNVVAFMEAIERVYPTARVGLYTGYWWFIEHSNAVANFSHYQYLKSRPLWLAWYASDASYVKIPAPWSSLVLWQFGTPAEDWGQSSAEIDMNYFNGGLSEFYERYKSEVPTQPPTEPTGDIMAWYKVTASVLNIRDEPGLSGADVGDLLLGDIIEVSETIGGWRHIVRIWRGSAFVTCPPVAWCKDSYTVTTDAPVIPPPPVDPDPADEIIVDVDVTATINGRTYRGTIGGLTLVEETEA